LRAKGSGLIVVDRNDESLVAKASHIGRFASRGRLAAVLGEFQKVGAERETLGSQRTTSTSATDRLIGPSREPKTYRRDLNRRADRREERATAREQLYSEFQKARAARWRFTAAWERQRDRERARYAEITAQKRTQRDRLVPHVGMRAARTIAAAVAAHQREEARAINGRERAEFRATLHAERTVSWREFVAERALAGDESAISALHGLRYQAGRERRRNERDGFATQGMAGEPRPRVFDGLSYQVQRSGAVAFYRTNDPTRREIFRDDGWFIAVHELGDLEITAALRLAAEKWGRSIVISGSREFKERSLTIAVELGIEVRNRELAKRQQKMRHERESRLRHLERQPMTRDRDDRDWR